MARRVLHDKYFKKAKRDGYVARSAYKLLELQDRARKIGRGVGGPLIRPGDVIVDLGCAPGSWMQAAAELAGDRGFVVGVDLLDASPVATEKLRGKAAALVGDAREFTADDFRRALPERLRDVRVRTRDSGESRAETEPVTVPRLASVLLSDMAPNTSGHGDAARSVRLCEDVLDAAIRLLRPNGRLCMKVFEGDEVPELVNTCRGLFRGVRLTKPDATRSVSKELYVIGVGYRRERAVPDEAYPGETSDNAHDHGDPSGGTS